jgi:hypothetical protein
MRDHLFDCQACPGEPARHLVVGQFQGLRAGDRAVKLYGKACPIVLQHREFFFDIVAFRFGLQTALASDFEVIDGGTEAFKCNLQASWRTQLIISKTTFIRRCSRLTVNAFFSNYPQ